MTTDTLKMPKVRKELKEPGLYKVIYLNDDSTTMDFVIESLVMVFNHTRETAEELTTEIHVEGSAVAAVLPYELAEQKGVEVTTLARNNGFPLQVRVEEE